METKSLKISLRYVKISNNNLSDLVPKCMICGKEKAVLEKATIGGHIVDVCPNCLKYGKKVDITEIDKITVHSTCERNRHIFLGKSKGD